jgi:molybdate transport system substrate-binding protein
MRTGIATAAGVVCVVALVAALAFTRPSGEPGQDDALVVLASASLADATGAVLPDARIRAGGSDQLAFQIESGAAGDLILSADPAIIARLHAAGLTGPATAVARNRLTVIAPASNPAGITSPPDLARPGVRLALGTESAPVGAYARDALGRLGLEAALGNLVSAEPDVRGVVAKVAFGDADAGIVYATDAAAAAGRLTTIPLPPEGQPRIVYSAAVVTGARRPEEAAAAIARLRSPAGQQILRERGFGGVTP